MPTPAIIQTAGRATRLLGGMVAGGLLLALLFGMAYLLANRRGEEEKEKLPLLPPITFMSYGRLLNYGFGFRLEGDAGSIPGPQQPMSMTVYQLAPPEPVSREQAMLFAREKFGATSEPEQRNESFPGGREIVWQWRSPEVAIYSRDGSFSWSSSGSNFGRGRPDATEAARITREWLADKKIGEQQGEAGDVFVLEENTADAERPVDAIFRSKWDGLPLYTLAGDYRGMLPGINFNHITDKGEFYSLNYTPPRKTLNKRSYPLRPQAEAWEEVLRNPNRRVSYVGYVEEGEGTLDLQPLQPEREYGLGVGSSEFYEKLPIYLDMKLERAELGYVYVGDSGMDGALYLIPVYAFTAKGVAPNGEAITAQFLAPALSERYVPQWTLPQPDAINIYRGGKVLTLGKDAPGYMEMWRAAEPVLQHITYPSGNNYAADWLAQRNNMFGVEIVYSSSGSGHRVQLQTDFIQVVADRIFVPLEGKVGTRATVWVNEGERWSSMYAQGGRESLLEASERVIGGRTVGGAIPTYTPTPTYPPATMAPATPGVPPTPQPDLPTPVPTAVVAMPNLPPPVETVYPTQVPTPVPNPDIIREYYAHLDRGECAEAYSLLAISKPNMAREGDFIPECQDSWAEVRVISIQPIAEWYVQQGLEPSVVGPYDNPIYAVKLDVKWKEGWVPTVPAGANTVFVTLARGGPNWDEWKIYEINF